ncbi:glycoside hydrolase family 48 protein [Nonomuraea sp. NPDC050663]|uniref:glycoside hydrolase family 48 protein n=1 Tax=Nonomuraea sp. NPDC050663 TaxID=3364370 RepID=UPI003795BFBE
MRKPALWAALATLLTGMAVAAPAQAAVACTVTYNKTWEGGGGFGASIAITNQGDALNGWTLTFTFPGNQRITNAWDGVPTQNGANVSIANASYNANKASGAQWTVGFNGSGSGANPDTFAINGTTCTGPQQPQSLMVTPTSVSVPEGDDETFAVRLQSQPSSNVTVTTTAGTGDSDLTVASGTPLTFTPSNWNTPQLVSIAAAQDSDTTNGTRPFTVASAGLTSVTVNATESDNDGAQALVVTPTSLNVPEGAQAIVNVKLQAQPSGSVTVTPSAGAGDADLTLAGTAALTFTSTNWNVDQQVRINAADDADDDNGSRTFTIASSGVPSVTVTATEVDDDAPSNSYLTEFQTQYDKIKNPANGYFSPEGIPYHSVETLLVEAPDHGHQTTSEAFSYWLWMEAQYGRLTKNWAPFNNAWNIMEQYIIPSTANQPGGQSTYNPADPADYAPERNLPSQYPVPLSTTVVAGQDPLSAELQSSYGNKSMYAMHWLLDVDDVYGFGTGRGSSLSECGDNTKRVTYINTYQRGPQESVWETIPHPSCDTQRYGSSTGFPSLFIQGSTGNQWRYTAAPDADARAVQAAYWALTWATEQGNQSQLSATMAKAAKLGDYLRYAMYDKYFKNPGCTSPTCAAGSGKSSSAYLLNWYFAWGGAMDGAWAWRIGSSHNHGGYQNPLAAWVLSPQGPSALRPQSPTADDDWAKSLTRQVQFYTWLQSAEGAIAGGATNSWDGDYQQPPAGTPSFFGMAYDPDPVYHDPPSNQWFGFQAWGMERLAELYYVTGDTKAKAVLDKWAAWAISETTLGSGSTYQIPNEMGWSGAPAASFNTEGGTPGPNPGLHVTVRTYTNDVGVAAGYARTLIYYAAKSGNAAAKATAKGLLDRMLLLKGSKGITVPETRGDYNRFDDSVYVPSSFTGTMPNGDTINSSSTFIGIRSFLKNDPEWSKVQSHLNGGPAPTFTYHRFWAQSDIAMALADYGSLFPNG